MKVVTQCGSYTCGECGRPLAFEPISLREDTEFAIGACKTYADNCSRRNVRLKIPLTVIEVDVLESVVDG